MAVNQRPAEAQIEHKDIRGLLEQRSPKANSGNVHSPLNHRQSGDRVRLTPDSDLLDYDRVAELARMTSCVMLRGTQDLGNLELPGHVSQVTALVQQPVGSRSLRTRESQLRFGSTPTT